MNATARSGSSIGYAEKTAQLLADLAAAQRSGPAPVGLAKKTSNLFRDRGRKRAPRVDLGHFNRIIAVDAAAGTVEAEGMTTYADLADATLAHGTMPAVVPQLKSITLGGAVAGVGIEATSFRHGLVHDTIVAMDVLTGEGRIVRCTADNEHRDLFRGFPNSYGTLGYALGLTARTLPVRRYVHVRHDGHTDAARFFAAVEAACVDESADFVDGVVFAPNEHVLTVGRFVDDAPYASDYTYEHLYYRSLRERREDHLTVRDYLWRWDTDWFWCSKNVGAQHPLVRRLLGRGRLNSIMYQKIMRWNARWHVTSAVNRLRGVHTEAVIQDIDIPIARAAEFLDFLHDDVGLLPIWICPIRAPAPGTGATLYPLPPGTLSINFGFWDTVRSREPRDPGFVTRKIERKTAALGGVKSLYSDSYFGEDEFWSIYDRRAYEALKARYDPGNALGDLYAKCVLRQ
ncbi:MAG TPA: FAD-binding oxidoreductase [Casimicrobiaceae bacterium]|nr:FAD-binding oxidoreductase [Casimicrobiaceae bacterium]